MTEEITKVTDPGPTLFEGSEKGKIKPSDPLPPSNEETTSEGAPGAVTDKGDETDVEETGSGDVRKASADDVRWERACADAAWRWQWLRLQTEELKQQLDGLDDLLARKRRTKQKLHSPASESVEEQAIRCLPLKRPRHHRKIIRVRSSHPSRQDLPLVEIYHPLYDFSSFRGSRPVPPISVRERKPSSSASKRRRKTATATAAAAVSSSSISRRKRAIITPSVVPFPMDSHVPSLPGWDEVPGVEAALASASSACVPKISAPVSSPTAAAGQRMSSKRARRPLTIRIKVGKKGVMSVATAAATTSNSTSGGLHSKSNARRAVMGGAAVVTVGGHPISGPPMIGDVGELSMSMGTPPLKKSHHKATNPLQAKLKEKAAHYALPSTASSSHKKKKAKRPPAPLIPALLKLKRTGSTASLPGSLFSAPLGTPGICNSTYPPGLGVVPFSAPGTPRNHHGEWVRRRTLRTADYDINDIVVPLSTNVHINVIKYREIPIPSFRLVVVKPEDVRETRSGKVIVTPPISRKRKGHVESSDEETDDETYHRRHQAPERDEQRLALPLIMARRRKIQRQREDLCGEEYKAMLDSYLNVETMSGTSTPISPRSMPGTPPPERLDGSSPFPKNFAHDLLRKSHRKKRRGGGQFYGTTRLSHRRKNRQPSSSLTPLSTFASHPPSPPLASLTSQSRSHSLPGLSLSQPEQLPEQLPPHIPPLCAPLSMSTSSPSSGAEGQLAPPQEKLRYEGQEFLEEEEDLMDGLSPEELALALSDDTSWETRLRSSSGQQSVVHPTPS